jgi:DEAD/DEAH box helicase domain-containing protein
MISETAAVSIAIALRSALSQELGVEPQEIGWAVQNNKDGGIGYRDIYLFDSAAGGAGYVASATNMIESLLSSAREILNKCNCDKACHSCLLDFGTQHYAEHLDRKAALDWLNEEFFSMLRVPTKFCVFEPETMNESRGVAEGMVIALQKRPIESVSFVADGNVELWEVDSWPMWSQIAKVATRGIVTNLLLTESMKNSVPWSILHSLVSKANAREAKVYVVPDSSLHVRECRIAGVISSPEQSISWGVFDQNSLSIGPGWGQGTNDWPVVKGNWPCDKREWREIKLDSVENAKPGNCNHILVYDDLDGTLKSIGGKFWDLLVGRSDWLNDYLNLGAPLQIEYCDRYLKSPLTARVLFEFLHRFSSTTMNRSQLIISTTASSQTQNSYAVYQDWRDVATQKEVLNHLFKPYFDTTVSVFSSPHELRHARFLSIDWGKGKRVSINLDQGVGFYRTEGSSTFDFTKKPNVQANNLRDLNLRVWNQSRSMPLYILPPSSFIME